MKNTFLIVLIVASSYALNAQITSSELSSRRGPCFLKSVERIGQRFVDWECDDFDQIVDCNENLESDPGTNIVYTLTGQPFTGSCETCHMNGLRQHLIHFENGRATGTDTSYYESGCPQVVRTHIEGAENGKWVFFNDTSGLVAWEINFFNGEKHGKSVYFKQHQVGTDRVRVEINGVEEVIQYGVYENDTVRVEHHNNGILEGPRVEYFFPGSKVRRIANYKQGLLDGAFIEYNIEGSLLQELHYVLGQKDGEWKYYYDNGSLLKTESWRKDVKDGEFKTFYIQGTIQSIENYRRGEKHGEFIERFPDDKIKREAIYRRGELIEEHVYDKYGNEISTFGVEAKENVEDDSLPEVDKKRKRKKKKKNK